MVREDLYRARRPPEAIDAARRADGRRAGHVHVHLEPLHDAQARLVVRRGHHGVRVVVCDLECLARAFGRPVEPDVHSRKQLHAVHRVGGGLFHGRHDRHGLRRAAADRGHAPAVVCRRPLYAVHGGAGRLSGHPDEAPDGESGAVEVPQRHRRRRDAPQPLLQRGGSDEEGLRAAHRAGGGRAGGAAAQLTARWPNSSGTAAGPRCGWRSCRACCSSRRRSTSRNGSTRFRAAR